MTTEQQLFMESAKEIQMQIKIVNAKTGIASTREMNQKELQDHDIHQEKEAQKKIHKEEKAEARSAAEAKLIELGLTVEDLKALLG